MTDRPKTTGKRIRVFLKTNQFRFQGLCTAETELDLTIRDEKDGLTRIFTRDSLSIIEVLE